MRETLMDILEKVYKNHKTPSQAHADIMELFCPYKPEWLTKDDYEWSVALFAENKLNGVKFLADLSSEHVASPLKWSLEFLQKATDGQER